MTLSQITQARWFPTVSKPLLTGLLASGVVFGLHAVGVTSFTSNEANAAITPLVGFLVAAVSAKPQPSQPASGGADGADILKAQLIQAFADNPDLMKELLGKVAQQVAVNIHVDGKQLAQAVAQPPDDPQVTGVIR